MTWLSNIEGTRSLTEVQPQGRAPTALQTAAELAEANTARIGRRAEIRRKIAAAEIAEALHADLTAAMADCESRKESLASQHVADCAPLQQELAEIDRQQLDSAVAKAPRAPKLQARRAALSEELRRRNADLQLAIETEDRLLASLGVERREAGLATVGRSSLEAELMETSSHAMALRIWSSKQSAAAARLSAIQDRISRSGQRDAYAMALLEDAQSELQRAAEASAAAFKAALDEP